MSVSSVSFNTDVNVRYERLSTEYAKLRSHVKVLSEGVISERKKNEAFIERIQELEMQLHKVVAENESLAFRNEQLVKRVESLQDELDTAHCRVGSVKKVKLKKSKDAKELLAEIATLGERIAVMEEELQNKIKQNEELNGKMSELEEHHAREIAALSAEFARKLEEAESHKQKEHRPERPVKSVRPLEQSVENRSILTESSSPTPPPINEAYLQIAESTRNSLKGLSTLFELLYQRTQVYPFDASMELVPNHIKKLSSELATCSQLFGHPVEVVERCIEKAEFQGSTDVSDLQTALSAVVRHCRIMMLELLKRLAIEESKITWCDSQLEKLNNAFYANMCRLVTTIDMISSALASISSNDQDGGEKLCIALEEGVAVVKELESTFCTRWTIESRFPTASKKICCIGTATVNCLSRLVVEVGKMSARIHAINGLILEDEKAPQPSADAPSNDGNPFDDEYDEDTVTLPSSPISKESPRASIGVDTSDLMGSSESAACASSSPTSSRKEDPSVQHMISSLKSRVNTLESEREGYMVDLSLLRRKLENLGAKENSDGSHTEVEMLKQVNRERLLGMMDNLQMAECAMNYYKGECEILLRKYYLCEEEKRELEETVRDMRRDLTALTDELAIVRRGYDDQLSQMTEHVAELNGKLAGIKRERTEQKAPATPQRSGLKSLFLK